MTAELVELHLQALTFLYVEDEPRHQELHAHQHRPDRQQHRSRRATGSPSVLTTTQAPTARPARTRNRPVKKNSAMGENDHSTYFRNTWRTKPPVSRDRRAGMTRRSLIAERSSA